MRGRSIYGLQSSFVWYYKFGRSCKLTTAEAAEFAIAIVDKGPEISYSLDEADLYQVLREMKMLKGNHSLPSNILDAGAALPSRGARKSVNWAPKYDGPKRKMTQKHITSKPSSIRSCFQASESTKPVTKWINTKITCKEKVKSSTYSWNEVPLTIKLNTNFKEKVKFATYSHEQIPARIMSNTGGGGGMKREASAVGTKQSAKELKKAGSNSNKKARVVFSEQVKCNGKVEHQLDHGTRVIESGNEWVSVPLIGPGLEGKNKVCGNYDDMKPGTVQCSLEYSDTDVKLVFGYASEILQDSAKFLKSKFESEIHDTVYEELRKFHASAKSVLREVEHGIHLIRERQLQRVREEKAKIEAVRADEIQRLCKEIDNLSQVNLVVKTEKLRIEHDRDNLKNSFACELERAREALRAEINKECGEVVNALSKELATEQDKSCCQICFSTPRDAVVLPCMHFQYCNECLQKHQRRNKECPTCRTKISGVLLCNILT